MFPDIIIPDITSVTALVAALAAFGAVYYQRGQMRLQERQTALAERELKDRIVSLDRIVKQLDDERKSRERAVASERNARVMSEAKASDNLISSTFTFAGLAAHWQYHLALCVGILAGNLETITDSEAATTQTRAVKELAAALVMVQVAFKELTDALDLSEEERQRRHERALTAGEIFGLAA